MALSFLEEPRNGINGYVQITILSNDDAYGVVGFAQVKIPHLEGKWFIHGITF